MFDNASLIEINLYPYLTWLFYAALIFLSPILLKREKNLFTLFLISLVFETALIIDAGFFIRPSYIIGLILVLKTALKGLRFPARYAILLALFTAVALAGVFLNLDLIGKAQSNESRATFFRPIIQLGQLVTLTLVTMSVVTLLNRGNYFRQAVRILHFVSVGVALYAIWEIAAIYFHLPYLNLNNMLSQYWHIGFGTPTMYMFRPHVTFIEPIEMNNFQFLGIASSLAYRVLYDKHGWRYWSVLCIQLVVLIGSFSRSTLITVALLLPIFVLLYPRAVRSALGFFADRLARVLIVSILIISVVYATTRTPEDVMKSNVVSQALLTRLILNQNKAQEIKPWGRANTVREIQPLIDNQRLAFGVGLGNDANWKGGIGGSYSVYSQIILYTGVIGLSIFFIFVSSILYGLFRNYLRRSSDRTFRKVCWIFFVGFLAMLIQRLSFSGLLTDTYLWVAFALCIYLGHYGHRNSLLNES